MNAALSFAYRRIPSFRRENGGIYDLYVRVHSALYSRRMKALHRRGRHGRAQTDGRCSWCGHRPDARHDPVANVEAAFRYIKAQYGNED